MGILCQLLTKYIRFHVILLIKNASIYIVNNTYFINFVLNNKSKKAQFNKLNFKPLAISNYQKAI